MIMIGNIIFCQDYTSYSNANSYNYGFQLTFKKSKCFENSYEDQPYSSHSSFVPQDTSPYSRSSDFRSTPHCDQVDKWRLLNVLEFPSTYLPPKKSAIAKVFLSLDAAFEVVERNLKTLYLKK